MPVTKYPHLVWIDLEMSGLDIQKDKILEIACIITDINLTIIAEKTPIIIAQSQSVIDAMDDWNRLHHTQSGLIDALRKTNWSNEEAEREVLSFVKEYCDPQKSPLCGSSIWVDRLFLRINMPLLESYLNYRVIDVSTVKLLANYWYSQPGVELFKKKKEHRALDDIKESINELKFYRENYFKK